VHGDEQVGFARVVTDYSDFAWLCDVYVDEAHRGNGLGELLVQAAVEHPQLQGLRRLILATRDAHTLYEKFGFKTLNNPEKWMELT
jgi:GNAT superfamily N-acetyltransferase